ncbi:hypothetical protein PCL1606_53560 [Pseudomonas chlororaphis]|uniref:Uncharacterized protein n=1 Tax=Pseudomonas chlororaphis TaxID=587753 RepID=A0A0D5Y756_9PSED|nr:hypothetical protein PCL1606_53560 [Pseudomonas chlororaphis]
MRDNTHRGTPEVVHRRSRTSACYIEMSQGRSQAATAFADAIASKLGSCRFG